MRGVQTPGQRASRSAWSSRTRDSGKPLARHDENGNQRWLHQFGTSQEDRITALIHDIAGGVMAAGDTYGNLGGPNAGLRDAFLAGFDSAGNQRWVRQFGSIESDTASSAAPDDAGGIMVAGSTNGGLGGPNAGSEDAFLARYATGICYADCNQDNIVNTFDFICYLNQYNTSDPAADCNGDGIVNTFDFLCFLNAYNDGC